MRYFGGKSRIAKPIAALINAERQGAVIWDPFCGGLASAAALGGPIICSDVHPGLINLHRSMQANPAFLDWIPELDAADYEWAAAELDRTDPIAAFIGFGCSFRGMWFRGLVAPTCPNGDGVWYWPVAQARRRLKADHAAIPGTRFAVADFTADALAPVATLFPDFWPEALFGPQRIGLRGRATWPRFLYLDPPYRNVEGYAGVPPFDYDRFLDRVDDWARTGATVFVSEYSFPMGSVVWERPRSKSGASRKGEQPNERLYRIGGR